MNNILNYIKNPIYCKIQKFEYNILLKAIALAYIFHFLLTFIRIPFSIIFKIQKIEAFQHPDSLFIFQAVIIAPILEEFLCRYFLRPTYKNLMIYLIVLFPLLVYYSIIKKFSILVIILIYFVLYRKQRKNATKFYRWYLKYFKMIFYSSCILFGMLHMSNYQNFTPILILPLIIMILPQIFMGAILGFTRMKYGIVYSILLHSCINFIGLLPSIIKLVITCCAS